MANFIVDLDRADHYKGLENGDIVFCKTDLLICLFEQIKDFSGQIKLISHKSDTPITEELFFKKPSCVKKWFAQNVDYQHPDLTPVPIGIENHDGPSKGSCIDLEFVKNNLPILNLSKEKKIYSNFTDTHSNRFNVRNFLKKSQKVFTAQNILSSADYHKEMSNYEFVASPRGNGIDCHRTWEALLVGSFPIVERHFMYDTYPTLPIIQIDSWDEVLEENFFNKTEKTLSKKRLDLSALSMSYWREKIYGIN